MKSHLALIVLLVLSMPARAVDLLDTAENVFYKPGDDTRMGLEVEFKGMNPKKAAQVVAEKLGGQVVETKETYKTTVKEVLKDGTKVYNEATNTEYVIKGSRIGDVVLKPDFNQVSDVGKIDMSQVVVELVTPPIRMPEVEQLQGAMDALKDAGATGTDGKTAVSIQVNTEIAKGVKADVKTEDIVNLMRSYMRPEHRAQIDAHLQVPKIRKKYAEPYSKGFLKKLLDPDYKPTMRELYDDYIYRQSLEMLGNKKAWTMPIEEARAVLLAAKDPIVPKVVKLNPLRVSSLLMWMEPEDPMTKLYHSSGWAVPRPLVEFREWNNDFRVVSPSKQALGLIQGAKDYGYYDHDKVLYSLSGVDEESIQELRDKIYAPPKGAKNAIEITQQQQDRKTIFRYFLGDPKDIDIGEYENMFPHYRNTNVGFLPEGVAGAKPMKVPGESVVFHRRHLHKTNITGKYNPGLVNANIQQALENKIAEYNFFHEYAPGSMAESEALGKMFKDGKVPAYAHDMSVESKIAYAKKLEEYLSRKFPGGWVMKGAWDLGSEKDIITHKTSIAAEYEKFLKSDFFAYRDKILTEHPDLAHAAPEYLQSELKKHPAYKGYQISKMIENPENTMAQQMLNIKREFRVEAMGGKVLGNGSTVDRYEYMYKYGKIKGKYVKPTKEEFEKVEKFAQWILDKLPPELRGMPMGMDIALEDNGNVFMVESNPGGNSNYLFEEERASILAHEKFLQEYPDLVKNGKVHPGLSPEEQMTFLKKKFSTWDMDTVHMYPGMKFEKDRIVDPDIATHEVGPEYYTVQPKKPRAPAAVPKKRADILDTAENVFYKKGGRRRSGIEVEFKGLDPRQAADLVAKELGGKVEVKHEVYKTTVKEVLPDGTKVYNESTNVEYVVKNSSIGNVILKPDLNQVADTGPIDMSQVVTELVTEPIREPEVAKLQRSLDALKAAGATGTDAETAVATQVNVEIGLGDPAKNTKPQEIVDLMRSYMKPEHRAQIQAHLQVPKIRQKYAKPYSEGMMKKLLDPNYKPTWRELYDDYIYRQSLEMLAHAHAWTMPIEKAHAALLAAAEPIVPEVVKLNPLRISSLLMYIEKDDPMTKLYHSSGWAVPRPLVEFREWNNDFTIVSPTKQALGLIEGAKEHGFYDHDTLIHGGAGGCRTGIFNIMATALKK